LEIIGSAGYGDFEIRGFWDFEIWRSWKIM